MKESDAADSNCSCEESTETEYNSIRLRIDRESWIKYNLIPKNYQDWMPEVFDEEWSGGRHPDGAWYFNQARYSRPYHYYV